MRSQDPAIASGALNFYAEERYGSFAPFEEAYIRALMIKEIEVTISHKDEGFTVKRTGEQLKFKFTGSGKLTRYRRRRGFSSDTVLTEILYDEYSKPVYRSTATVFGIRYSKLHYDREGRLEKSEEDRPGRHFGEPSLRFYRDIHHDDTLRETRVSDNAGQLIYREIFRTDHAGRLLYYAKFYAGSEKRIQTEFRHEAGRLSESISVERTQLGSVREKRTAFHYGGEGLLRYSVEFIDGKRAFRHEYLFENDLLIAKLTKNYDTGRIIIREISYSFWD